MFSHVQCNIWISLHSFCLYYQERTSVSCHGISDFSTLLSRVAMFFIFISNYQLVAVENFRNTSVTPDDLTEVFHSLGVVVPSCPWNSTWTSMSMWNTRHSHQPRWIRMHPRIFISSLTLLFWFLAPPATSVPLCCQTQGNPPQLQALALLDAPAFHWPCACVCVYVRVYTVYVCMWVCWVCANVCACLSDVRTCVYRCGMGVKDGKAGDEHGHSDSRLKF